MRLIPKDWRGWLIDRQPASVRYTDTGLVLGSDIVRRVQISMKRITARMTREQPSRTPIVAGLIAAARTGLRGVARVNPPYNRVLLPCT